MTSKQQWVLVALAACTIIVHAIGAPQSAEKSKPAAAAAPSHFIVAPADVKWSDPPAGVSRGTPSVDPGSPLHYALIQGDPLKPGAPFTIRLGCADGYKAAPHWHPGDENIVVLKGAFGLGTGDVFDPSSM